MIDKKTKIAFFKLACNYCNDVVYLPIYKFYINKFLSCPKCNNIILQHENKSKDKTKTKISFFKLNCNYCKEIVSVPVYLFFRLKYSSSPKCEKMILGYTMRFED